MEEPSLRFPSPWRPDKIAGGYLVREANGQAPAYLYSRDNDDEARQAWRAQVEHRCSRRKLGLGRSR
jgi:hypothetical protein